MTFEDALKKLEAAVTQLESGDVSLEKALKTFETGITMSRICTKHLEAAEQKVELLLGVAEDGTVQTAPFETDIAE